MSATLLTLGIFTMTGLWTILAMMQFVVGEPTGRHSKFSPNAVPAREYVGDAQPFYATFHDYPVRVSE